MALATLFMDARNPLIAHRVAGRQGQIAALGGGRHGLGAGHSEQARTERRQRGSQGQRAKF